MTGCCSHRWRRLGITAEPAVWDDPSVDWAAYDLVVLRSTWDYARRRDEFVAWARDGAPAGQPGRGRRVEHRQALPGVAGGGRRAGRADRSGSVPATVGRCPAAGEWVIKPAVSAGSLDTGRYASTDEAHRDLAAARMSRGCRPADRLVMVQPYLPAVDSAGETSLLFLGGAVLARDPQGPDARRPGRGRARRSTRRRRSRPARRRRPSCAVARAVLARCRSTVCCTPGWTSSRGRTGSRCSSSSSSPSRPCSSAPPTARPTGLPPPSPRRSAARQQSSTLVT